MTVGSDPMVMAVIGLIGAAWIAASAWAIVTGVAMRRRAEAQLRATARLSRLIESAPAIPVVVRVDGRVEAPERLSEWLGLTRPVEALSDLAGGDVSGGAGEAIRQLDEAVRLAQRTGSTFAQPLRLPDSPRTLLVRGGPADPRIYPNGAAVLWVFDATDSEGQISRLRSDLGTARSAFQALSGLIEAAPLPMWHRAGDLRLTLVNSAYVEAVGAAGADEVVRSGIELVEPVAGLTAIASAARARETREPAVRDVTTTIGGQRHLVRVVDVPLGDSGIAGYAIDQQALAEVTTEYRRFVDAQRGLLDTISAAVVQFGADQRLVFANMPFRCIFALRDSWLNDSPEFARVLDRIREAGRAPETRDFPEWRAEHVAWFRIAEPAEENWHLGDGTFLRVLARPQPDGGLILIFEDRTEQVQLASARDTLLRARTATFDRLFEAVAVFAADGRLNLWNRRFGEVWRVEEDVLATHPRIDALLQEIADRLKKPSQVSVLRELVRAASSQRVSKSGRVAFADDRFYDFSAIPLPDGNVLFTMLDTTDSRRIEQALRDRNAALEEADAIKGRFLSNMAYEFRTPLTSIGGFAELLAAGIAGPLSPQAQEYVDAILTSVERLAGQINSVLDLSQSEAGALPIAKRDESLRTLVETSVARAAAFAAEQQATVKVDLRDTLGDAACDARRMGQALDHLIDNALRHGGRDVQLLVYGDGTQRRARIVVSDNGPGMDARRQAEVFDSFARSRAAGGSGGLGLPLARQLVEAHGGTLTLLSEPGEGTVVTIELPRA